MKKKDKYFMIFVILVIILTFFAAYLFKNQGEYALIISDGKEYMKIPLDKNISVSVKGKNTVTVEDSEVYVSYADCPDKLCMKQGKIGNNGGVIVCLPNKMTIKIEKR